MTIDFVMREVMDNPTLGIKWTDLTRLTDLDFADDLALLEESPQKLQLVTDKLVTTASKVGLRVSTEKTKIMTVKTDQPANIQINQHNVEEVPKFTYLGSAISNQGDIADDLSSRLGKANSVFRRLDRIWKSRQITLKSKVMLYTSLVLSVALYASETWKMTGRTAQRLDVFHQRCLRKILGISWQDRITNEEVLRRTKQRELSTLVKERRLKILGHTLRMPTGRHAKISLKWTPDGGKRKRGRPTTTWRRTISKDLQEMGLTWQEAETLAEDRKGWRNSVATRCSARNRRN